LARAKLDVIRCEPAGDKGSDLNHPDRLVAVNPNLFGLIDELTPDAVTASEVRRVRFLGQAGDVAETTEGFEEQAAPRIVRLGDLQTHLGQLAETAGVRTIGGKVKVMELDDATGVQFKIGSNNVLASVVVASDGLTPELANDLGASEPSSPPTLRTSWDVDQPTDGTARAALDLDAGGSCCLAFADGSKTQICVHGPEAAAEAWGERLAADGLGDGKPNRVTTSHLSLGGALERDVVGRLTLFCGPVGGFVSATGEEIYPCCWSAQLAAKVAAKAMKASHVQDALGAFRSTWGATLGEYLQGPQQNMRFLLPLVYKNHTMTNRVADALFRGKSLVR
jgi:flavin-dependent dehydrogenase